MFLCAFILSIGLGVLVPKHADAYYSGRVPGSTDIPISIPNVTSTMYSTAWNSAINNWNNNVSRNQFIRHTSGNIASVEFDSARPSAYGRIIYQGASNRTTPFRTYLNSIVADIRDFATVRRSTIVSTFCGRNIFHPLRCKRIQDLRVLICI
ncbi:hypothetical protein P4U44_16305, partial [Alkalihalobacillus alcalophilus]|uniref:hypothetical protein n=3 Tax=Alkalihalobacillus alcalophilus TaxID=1445 RepID=UPI002E23A8E8|nr:hypothetical protein [Alkalihalobacillus alcalophilus]